jgi:hypothetical protein
LEGLQLMLNNRVIPNCYMIEVRCVDGNIRHFPRDPNGLWYTSAIAGGRFGGRRPGSAGRGQREQARHAVQPAWSSRRPRVALLPNEAAARPPAAFVEQAFSPRAASIGKHPWSESS